VARGFSAINERNVCRHGRSGESKISSPSFLSSSTLMVRIDFSMAFRRSLSSDLLYLCFPHAAHDEKAWGDAVALADAVVHRHGRARLA
jgi:hypothetical protein